MRLNRHNRKCMMAALAIVHTLCELARELHIGFPQLRHESEPGGSTDVGVIEHGSIQLRIRILNVATDSGEWVHLELEIFDKSAVKTVVTAVWRKGVWELNGQSAEPESVWASLKQALAIPQSTERRVA